MLFSHVLAGQTPYRILWALVKVLTLLYILAPDANIYFSLESILTEKGYILLQIVQWFLYLLLQNWEKANAA